MAGDGAHAGRLAFGLLGSVALRAHAGAGLGVGGRATLVSGRRFLGRRPRGRARGRGCPRGLGCGC